MPRVLADLYISQFVTVFSSKTLHLHPLGMCEGGVVIGSGIWTWGYDVYR